MFPHVSQETLCMSGHYMHRNYFHNNDNTGSSNVRPHVFTIEGENIEQYALQFQEARKSATYLELHRNPSGRSEMPEVCFKHLLFLQEGIYMQIYGRCYTCRYGCIYQQGLWWQNIDNSVFEDSKVLDLLVPVHDAAMVEVPVRANETFQDSQHKGALDNSSNPR